MMGGVAVRTKGLLSAEDRGILERLWDGEGVRRWVLGNGVKVIFQRDEAVPVVSAQVWVKTGSIDEGRLLGSGVSHFLEHMLFKGTERRKARDISAEVQGCGGSINAYTSFERTVYHVDLPAEFLRTALDVLSDMVLNSTLDGDEMAKERDVVLREIEMGKDDVDGSLSERLWETVFRDHAYRFPVIGVREVFERLTREDVWGYYRERYVSENLTVVVTGAVEVPEVEKLVEEFFGKAERGVVLPVLEAEERAQLGRREEHKFEEVEVSRVAMAWQIPGLVDVDAPVLDLLAMVLGQGDSSLLWDELREKRRLVHSIDAYCWNPGKVGVFSVSFTCDAEKREEAVRVVEEVLARVVEKGVSAGRLKRAMRQMVVGEVNSRRTVSGLAGRLGMLEVVAGDVGFVKSYFERVGRVSAADVKRVAGTFLREWRATVVSSNPLEAGGAAGVVVKKTEERRGVELVELPNGVRVVLQRAVKLPSVHVRVLCEGGVLHEQRGLEGSTALMASLLTRDTKTRSAAEVAEAIEGRGGSFYPFSGANSFGMGLDVLKGDEELGLGLLEEALLGVDFAGGSFEVEREAQVAGLLASEDDVLRRGRRLLRRKFFGEFPLASEANGAVESVKKISTGDLEELWGRLGVTGNMVVSVAGNFEREEMLERLEKLLVKVSVGKAAERKEAFGGVAEAGEFLERMEKEQVVVLEGFEGAAVGAEDFYVGEVADELFSGMSARLFERVREELGLAYYVRSGRISGVNAGMFMFYAGTAPGKEREVLREIWAEIERVKSGGVTEEELKRCRTRLLAGRVMGLQTNAARAMHAGLNALYGLPVEDGDFYRGKIEDVGIGELAEFARRRFVEERRVRVLAGCVKG